MDCSDLTTAEHSMLTVLSKARNRRTGVVAYNKLKVHDYNGDTRVLIELGYVERIGYDRSLRVLHPCSGHSDPRGGLQSGEARQYTCGAGVLDVREPISVSSKGPRSIAGGVRNANIGIDSRSQKRYHRKIAKDLLDYFDNQSRTRYDWLTPLSTRGRLVLTKYFFDWQQDGASEEDITMMIEIFFDEIEHDKGKSPWRQFVARRFKLKAAQAKAKAARQYEEGVKNGGGDFYSQGSGLTAEAVNESFRDLLGGDDEEQ